MDHPNSPYQNPQHLQVFSLIFVMRFEIFLQLQCDTLWCLLHFYNKNKLTHFNKTIFLIFKHTSRRTLTHINYFRIFRNRLTVFSLALLIRLFALQ